MVGLQRGRPNAKGFSALNQAEDAGGDPGHEGQMAVHPIGEEGPSSCEFLLAGFASSFALYGGVFCRV